MSKRRTYRIGIDVGGTFTKAVLIDNAGFEVIGRYSVMTTHSHARGVAAGAAEVVRNVLGRWQVNPQDVVFLAQSSTQATNALPEGDVAAVGVIGMASRVESVLARGQSNVKDIELAPGRFLRPSHRFITTDRLDETLVPQTLEALPDEGAQAVAARTPFPPDPPPPTESRTPSPT